MALGERKGHVLRQLLIESFVLTIAAGVVGAIAAAWSTGAAIALMPDGALPRHVQPAVDARTLAFTGAISMLVAVLVTIAPAIAAARANVADVMKLGGRTLDPGLGAIRRISSQQLLVTAEIAAAMILLTIAGLLVRSLDRQMKVESRIRSGYGHDRAGHAAGNALPCRRAYRLCPAARTRADGDSRRA